MKGKNIIIIAILLFIVYVAYKMRSTIEVGEFDLSDPQQDPTTPNNPSARQTSNMTVLRRDTQLPQTRLGECQKPTFAPNLNFSGRDCAGSLLSETKVLQKGDTGCEVLLLQQRLNSIENQVDILQPNGKFCCMTEQKLFRLMGVDRFALNQFSPDEQIGFNSLQAGTKLTPHSYMDADQYKSR